MSNHGGINAALLNMCARAQNSKDDPPPQLTSSSALERKDPPRGTRAKEDYTWLQEALASVEPTEKKILRLLETIEEGKDVSGDDYISAIEELSDLVEDINWATEFNLMNGPERVLKVLRENEEVKKEDEARDALVMVMAHAAQLNDAVQRKFCEAHWEEYLVPLLREYIKSKSPSLAPVLHACSCLCRSCEYNTVIFIREGGLDALTEILATALKTEKVKDFPEKVVRRTLFFVGSLAEFGISTESLMRLVCKHVSSCTATEAVQVTGAQALVDLATKSLATVKSITDSEMKDKLREWKRLTAAGKLNDARSDLSDKLCVLKLCSINNEEIYIYILCVRDDRYRVESSLTFSSLSHYTLAYVNFVSMRMKIIGYLSSDFKNAVVQGAIECQKVDESSSGISLDLVFTDSSSGRKWMGLARQSSTVCDEIKEAIIDEEKYSATELYILDGPSLLGNTEPNTTYERNDDKVVTPRVPTTIDDKNITACITLANILAQRGLSTAEVLQAISLDSGIDDITQNLNLISDVDGNGVRELNARGYSLLNMDYFLDERVKRIVANRAYVALSRAEGYEDASERFLPFVDRDVVLLSNSGGIMSGLGATKQSRKHRREETPPLDTNADILTKNVTTDCAVNSRLDKCPLPFDTGDITRTKVTPPEEALIATWSAKRNHSYKACKLVPQGVIRNNEELIAAEEDYDTLVTAFHRLMSSIQAHSDLTAKIKDWRQTIGAESRCTPELNEQLKIWLNQQVEARNTVEKWMHQLQTESLYLEREITEFLLLDRLALPDSTE
eukprot:gene7188-5050_t